MGASLSTNFLGGRPVARIGKVRAASISVVLLALAAAAVAQEPWSRFRGPNGAGIAEGAGYPVKLEPQENARWRTPARPGKSSPVLSQTRVYLTGSEGGRLYTQCFERASGRLLWERSVEPGRSAEMNRLNEPASITPVVDGDSVHVLFRDVGLLSYDADGGLRWRTELEPFANSMGHASSPVVIGERLIVQADQKRESYLAAFDTSNGELLWKVPRVEGEGWATPVTVSGRVLTTSRGWIAAHDSASGKRLWGLELLSPSVVASPAVVGDIVYTFGYGNESLASFARGFDARDTDGDGKLRREEYASHAFMVGVALHDGDRDGILTREEYLATAAATVAPSRLFAFRLGREGPPRELWRYERSFIHVIPSPLVYRGTLYFIKNGGIVESLDAATGEVLERRRLRKAIGGYSASPVAADGKVYFASEDGTVTTVAAGRDWRVLATSELGAEIFATPALSGGEVIVRAGGYLYCFSEP